MTQDFPKEEIYGLTSQMRRAGVSIASNIAEGSAKTSELDFSRFLEIAQGSSFELETQIIIANEIGYITSEELQTQLTEINTLQKQITKLITILRNSHHSKHRN